MTNDAFHKLLQRQHLEMLELGFTKGREYANSEEDRLANFKQLAADLKLSSTQILMVYLEKHLRAIKSYVANGNKSFSTEHISGRIRDAQLYLSLLEALIIDLKVMDTVSTKTDEEEPIL